MLERLREKYGNKFKVEVKTREDWDIVVGKLLDIGLIWIDGTTTLSSKSWNVWRRESIIVVEHLRVISFSRDCNYITADEFMSNFDKIKIEAGINGTYKVGEYLINWYDGFDYSACDTYSKIKVTKNETLIISLGFGQDFEIRDVNSVLKSLNINAEIVEKEELISISTQSGQTIEISRGEAEKLGFL